jgi:hypothetical protein
MSLETRASEAARDLRSATTLDTEAGLTNLRRTHRRRGAARVAAAALTVAAVVGGVAVWSHDSDRAVPPANRVPHQDGIVVNASSAELTPLSDVGLLPEAGEAPFPAWAAFDQQNGRFLYTASGSVPTDAIGDLRTLIVLAPGEDEPVASIDCEDQCNWHPSMGPGPDEVTIFVYSQGGMARVYGFDGTVREEIDLSEVLQGEVGLADLEWSPDGTQLAVSTFKGGPREPDCNNATSEARVYLYDRVGGEPELVHSEVAEPQPDMKHPVLSDLAWTSDGQRLGLISSSYCAADPYGEPPAMVAVDVGTGRARTLHRFELCADCPVDAWTSHIHGFAWSPDGTRIAVTSGQEISELSSDGEVLDPERGYGPGPLAWLDAQDG